MIDWLSNNAKTLKRAAGLTSDSSDGMADSGKSISLSFSSNALSSSPDQAQVMRNFQLALEETQLDLIRLQTQILIRIRNELDIDVKKHCYIE